jgi:ADP-ribose 1''-phosphate phosphatase
MATRQFKIVKRNLFNDAHEYKAHACNCLGQWGSGIAKEFAQRYPVSYKEYRDHCKRLGDNLLGSSFITSEKVVCLFTSLGYASTVDAPFKILAATRRAVNHLLMTVPDYTTIYSNKFNSGLFRVPWENTEDVLTTVLNEYPNRKWVVCDYDPKKAEEGREGSR